MAFLRQRPLRLLVCVAPIGKCLYDSQQHIESARLYGNLEVLGYYFLDILVGSPAQRVSVILDTGSSAVAFPCKTCKHCGNHVDPPFDFESSSTAQWQQCTDDCLEECAFGRCSYYNGYSDGSSIHGFWFYDWVQLGDAHQRNPRIRGRLGCHNSERSLFFSQRANGVMGIGPDFPGNPALMQSIIADNSSVAHEIFSLCFSDWGGRLVVGGWNNSYHLSSIQWIPLNVRLYYELSLTSIRLGHFEVRGPFGNIFIDTGTTFVYVNSIIYQAIRYQIEDYCEKNDGCGTSPPEGSCFEMEEDQLAYFPSLEFYFDNVKTVWAPKGYLYPIESRSKWCYAFHDDGDGADTVLGAAWLLHRDVIFDLGRKLLGVVPASCPEYWIRPMHNLLSGGGAATSNGADELLPDSDSYSAEPGLFLGLASHAVLGLGAGLLLGGVLTVARCHRACRPFAHAGLNAKADGDNTVPADALGHCAVGQQLRDASADVKERSC